MTTSAEKICYKRVMIKFSGEALIGNKGYGIDPIVVENIACEISQLVLCKVQVGVIIGGGNFFRGALLNHQTGISRVTGDHLGMIATVLNALAMKDIFEHQHVSTRIMSALPIDGIVERYDRNKASEYLAKNFVVIFAGGTGNPFVTTDTTLGLRGAELEADLLLKATNVDGIYSEDPQKNPNAKFYSRLTYHEILLKELKVMDLAAFCLCRDHKMKLRVFNMHKKGALFRIVSGANEGTLVE